jgi:hypothetical protein
MNGTGRRSEPRFEDMLRDPAFLDLMASDRVPMESFLALVGTVRQRLGLDDQASTRPN